MKKLVSGCGMPDNGKACSCVATWKQDEVLKVLHCPTLVGGQATGLARQERLLGVCSTVVSWQESPFGYLADEILWPKKAGLFSQEMARWQLFGRALNEFDVIHYNSGAPILNWGSLDGHHRRMACGLGGVYAQVNRAIELPLLKKWGKVIAVTYQGDDARQGDFSREHFPIGIANEVDEGYYSSLGDQGKRERIAAFAAHADLIYALNPDLLHVLPSRARFLPYAHVDLGDWRGVDGWHGNSRPLVVHAPSHRGTKGTHYVLAAVESLKSRGIPFDFQLVEGLTRYEAKKIYERADLVIDQLLAGWYGGFSVEVMALGKPVICYLRHEDFSCLPERMRNDFPLIEASPDSIGKVLEEWLTCSTEVRQVRGALGRSFVERWHNPREIAAQLLTDYQYIIKNDALR